MGETIKNTKSQVKKGNNMNDEDILNDVLISYKHLVSSYATALNEASNKNIYKLANQVIIEYDLKSANTSLCKEYGLLPKETIKEIEELPKKERVVRIGKLMRKDKTFTQNLKKAFIDIRRRFFEENQIEDEDILAIKKDAIFCLKEVKYTDFGECYFSDKNRYTSYMYLNGFEFYYKSSLMGKLKVWIMALCVGGCFLLSDYHTLENILSFIKLPILDINDINKSIKFLTDLAIGAEVATLGSYIARDIKETNDKVRDNELKDNRVYSIHDKKSLENFLEKLK